MAMRAMMAVLALMAAWAMTAGHGWAGDLPAWRLQAGAKEFVGGPVAVPTLPGEAAPPFLRAGDVKEVTYCQTDPEMRGAVTLAEPLAANAFREYRLWPARLLPPNLVELKETNAGLEISVRGKLFTIYRHSAADGPKPYCWPIIGPTDAPVTRAYPMVKDAPGEPRDHPHQRSMWFTHGKVNGNDFWSETPRAGRQVHRRFVRTTSGPVFGEFVAAVDWLAKDGSKVCEDTRRLRVWASTPHQILDFEIAIRTEQGELVFGDDKEGTFGFRVASSMDVKQKDKTKKGGAIVNSNGAKDGATWGKQAAWVDYSGPVDGKTVGIAIFDAPTNLRHPSYWHVRDYGLFAANPFGLSFFEAKKTPKPDGTHRVPAGGELRLFYRVVIHPGDAASAQIAEHYAHFAAPKKLEPIGSKAP